MSHPTRSETRTHGRRSGALPGLRERYPLGTSGLLVSPVCLGITLDPKTVCEAFDAGINFFFLSADMHWPLYDGLRRGLEMLLARGGGIRDQIVVGSVSYVTQPEFCFAPHTEALAAVRGLGRLDVTIAGGSYGSDLAIRLTQYAAHRAGLVPGARAVGVSFHDRSAALLAIEHAMIDVGFVRFNASHPGARKDLFPRITTGGPLVYNFKTTSGHVPADMCARLLEGDSWVPRLIDHYRYALSHAEVDGVLCALTEPGHVRALEGALAEGPLSDDECDYLEELSRRRVRLPPSGP